MQGRALLVTVTTAAALAGALLAGCASTPVERQQATVQSLVDLSSTMAATQQQIEQTLAALITLMHAPPRQVTQAFTRYASAANAMAAQAGRIEAEAGQLRERRDAWLAGWNASYAQVSDRQLRALSEERRAQVLAQFETIEGSLAAARDALVPFVENLEDIKEVAANDLSPLALRALERTAAVQDATRHGREAAQALRVSTNDLQALIRSLAPSRAASAPE